MIIRSMRLTIGETVNLGNYSTKRMELGLETDFEGDDDSDSVYDSLKQIIEAKLAKFKDDLLKDVNNATVEDRKVTSSYTPKHSPKMVHLLCPDSESSICKK